MAVTANDAQTPIKNAEAALNNDGNATSASDKILSEVKGHFTDKAGWIAPTLADGSPEYVQEVSRLLEQRGLLPSVTLAYLDNDANFNRGERGEKDGVLTRKEVEKFISEAKNLPAGGGGNTQLDGEMYKNVLKYMKDNGLEQISRSEIQNLRQDAEQKFDQKKIADGYYNSRVLMNTDENGVRLMDRISPNGDRLSKNDLEAYLKNQTDEYKAGDEGKAVDWLIKNWDEKNFQENFLDRTGFDFNLRKYGFENKLQAGAVTAGLNSDGTEKVAAPKPFPDKQEMGKDTRQGSNHDFYFSDGKGNTIALDGKDKNNPDKITMGNTKADNEGNKFIHYTAWAKENGRWILYDGEKAVATANKVEVDKKTGRVSYTGFSSLEQPET